MSFPGFPFVPSPGPGPAPTPSTHNLLSSTHGDTTPASGVNGDVIVYTSGSWQRIPAGPELSHFVINGGVPEWGPLTGSGLGDVTGPSSATDNAIARYDGATGKLIQNSNVLIDDADNLSVAGNTLISGDLTVLGNTNLGNVTITGILNTTGPVVNSVASGSVVTFIVNNNNYFNAIQSGVTTVAMPATPQLGQQHVIKDIAGIAGTSNIVVNGSGNTIDGGATTTLAIDYQSITLIYGPTEWNII